MTWRVCLKCPSPTSHIPLLTEGSCSLGTHWLFHIKSCLLSSHCVQHSTPRAGSLLGHGSFLHLLLDSAGTSPSSLRYCWTEAQSWGSHTSHPPLKTEWATPSHHPDTEVTHWDWFRISSVSPDQWASCFYFSFYFQLNIKRHVTSGNDTGWGIQRFWAVTLGSTK